MRLAKSGDVFVGVQPHWTKAAEDFVVGTGSGRPTLVHNLCEETIHLAICPVPKANGLDGDGVPPFSTPVANGRYFSSAPLEGVICAKVFYRECAKVRTGVLLEYANGAKRALGECRLAHDPYIETRNPEWFRFRHEARLEGKWVPDPVNFECFNLAFGVGRLDDDYLGASKGWSHHLMSGTMEILSGKTLELRVIPRTIQGPPTT